MYFICTDCSVREYRFDLLPIMLALCWHNISAYYALNYVGIFDGDLVIASLNLIYM